MLPPFVFLKVQTCSDLASILAGATECADKLGSVSATVNQMRVGGAYVYERESCAKACRATKGMTKPACPGGNAFNRWTSLCLDGHVIACQKRVPLLSDSFANLCRKRLDSWKVLSGVGPDLEGGLHYRWVADGAGLGRSDRCESNPSPHA